MADQWDKTAKSIVEATYGRGPQAVIGAVAGAFRLLSTEMIKAGKELVMPVAQTATAMERQRCLDALERYAAYEGEEDPFDLVAAAIRQSSTSEPKE